MRLGWSREVGLFKGLRTTGRRIAMHVVRTRSSLVCRVISLGVAAAAVVYVLPATVILSVGIAMAAEYQQTHFDARRAIQTVTELSANEMAGRKSGLPSGAQTEDYVARQFAAWGLAPAGVDQTFFQPFPMLVTDERGAEMELLDSPYGKVAFLYGDDFTLVTNSGSGDVTAEVVVVGHGLCDSTRNWDDYAGSDVAGKIVLIVRGAPKNGYDWDHETARDSTLHEAVRRGAAGVLYSQEMRPVHGGAVHDGSYFPATPVAYIGYRVVDQLFMDSGLERPAYEEAIANAPQPFATGKRLRLRADVVRLPDGSGRNVLAQVAGRDPTLAREVIVVGGHMDHLGTDGRGLIYNGADDNASGAATVMELARAFAASPPPARTIVFATFAGEEQGLLGSEAFVAKPLIAHDRIVAMVNLDMTGHGDGRAGLGGGEQFPEIIESFRAGLDSLASANLIVGRAWAGEGSDHAPFLKAGIATCNVWSEGAHRFSHSLQDDAGWIDSAAVAAAGGTAERWIRALADWPKPLATQHAAGRTLLRSSMQIDFDNAPAEGAPVWVAGGCHWFDAASFADQKFLAELGHLANSAADSKTMSLVGGLSEVLLAAWEWKTAHLIGLDNGAARDGSADVIPADDRSLLGEMHVALVRWNGAPQSAEDHDYLTQLSAEGVTFLVPPDTSWRDALPEGGLAVVRVFPGRGDKIENPAQFPRQRFFFVVSLNDPIAAPELAAMLAKIGWDRVHLDLVPWSKQAQEEEIWPYLEEVQAAGSFQPQHMRAMLGGNLERMKR